MEEAAGRGSGGGGEQAWVLKEGLAFVAVFGPADIKEHGGLGGYGIVAAYPVLFDLLEGGVVVVGPAKAEEDEAGLGKGEGVVADGVCGAVRGLVLGLFEGLELGAEVGWGARDVV